MIKSDISNSIEKMDYKLLKSVLDNMDKPVFLTALSDTSLSPSSSGSLDTSNEYRDNIFHYVRMEMKNSKFTINSAITKEGDAAIHKAVLKKDMKAVAILLSYGADIDLKGNKDNTPFLYASKVGFIEFLDFYITGILYTDTALNLGDNDGRGKILELSEEEQENRLKRAKEMKNKMKLDAVMMAVIDEKIESLQWLKKHDFAMNNIDSDGNSLLHLVAIHGKLNSLNWLIQNVGNIREQVYYRNDANHTPRDEAKDRSVVLITSLLKKLEQHEQSPSKRSENERKIFQYAREGNIEGMNEIYRENKAILTIRDKASQTPILEAATHGQVEAVKWLSDIVRDTSQYVNSKTGNSILHIAAEKDNLSLCEMAINQFSMDTANKNLQFQTPLDVAILNKSLNVQAYLKMIASRTFMKPPSRVFSTDEKKAIIMKAGETIGLTNDKLNGSLMCTITKDGSNYICSCMDFQIHERDTRIEERTCKHIKAILGAEADKHRIESAKIGATGAVAKRVAEWNTLVSSVKPANIDINVDKMTLNELFALPKSTVRKMPEKMYFNAQKKLMSMASNSDLPDDFKLSMETLKKWEGWRSMQRSDSASTVSSSFSSSTSVDLDERQPSATSLPSVDSEEMAKHFLLHWDEFKLGKIIGEGSFGVVFSALWRGMPVAVKQLRTSDIDFPKCTTGKFTAAEREEFLNEAKLLSRVCHHQNIVPFVGVTLEPRLSIVTNLMKASVEQLLVKPGDQRHTIDLLGIVRWLIDTSAGLLHLHQEQIIHRDLATRNLLVDGNGGVRIADFGFARIKQTTSSKGVTAQDIGPICWMAPEALRYRHFSEKSDVFSFALVIFEMITGRYPWEGVEAMDVVFRVCGGERENIPESSHPILIDLFNRCQYHDPSQRPLMSEVYDILLSLLSLFHSQAKQISNHMIDDLSSSLSSTSNMNDSIVNNIAAASSTTTATSASSSVPYIYDDFNLVSSTSTNYIYDEFP